MPQMCQGQDEHAVPNATACVDCQMGYYQNLPSQASCLSCLPGKFGNKLGFAEYPKCAKCKMNAVPNATACVDCQMGYYQDSPAQASCLPCLPGVGNKTGLAECHECDHGKMSAEPKPRHTWIAR